MEIVRGGCGEGEGERVDAMGFDGDYVVLVLEGAVD
jgi:hypothetical protein